MIVLFFETGSKTKRERHFSGRKSFTKLLTSYELRLLRFYLKIWYRAYDSSTDKWKLLKKELPIAEDRMWNVLLRFVSEI